MKDFFLLSVLASLLVLSSSSLFAETADKQPTYRFRSGRKEGHIDRIVALLEVGGDTTNQVEGKLERTKMKVVCKLAYDEKTLELPPKSAGPWRSIRYYDQAAAVLEVGKQQLNPTLRPERRLIGVEVDGEQVTLFSPRGLLTRKELELIDVLGNSLLMDQFLPEEALAVGATWKHSETLMAALLGLDAVGRADVQSKLTKVTDEAARMELVGRVEGALYGVSTEIELKAKYRFDRQRKRIDWFALLVKEQRSNSHVTDGVDVVARMQVQISPKAGSARLTAAALKNLALKPSAESRQLIYRPADGSWQFSYDRSWHVLYPLRQELVVLRMVDRGEMVAQCNVSPLPPRSPEKQLTLAEFQDDIKQALGESFLEFVEAGQRANEANYREYRVVVRGTARREIQEKALELPIQWSNYLLGDRHGRQMALTFTVESQLLDRFGQADRKLIRSFRFLDSELTSNAGK